MTESVGTTKMSASSEASGVRLGDYLVAPQVNQAVGTESHRFESLSRVVACTTAGRKASPSTP